MIRLAATMGLAAALAAPAWGWPQDGPQPPEVNPGGPGQAPAGAVVLFDGKDLSAWTVQGKEVTGWTIAGGVLTDVARHDAKQGSGTWDLVSKQKFGDAQIHVEFNIPDMPGAKGQAKGNSGVYLQGRYEIQVLDSWHNPTYANGSAGALYGQSAPLVNASRPPGEWQTYDIVFHAPRCAPDGSTAAPGSLTLLYNGVLVQDHVPVTPRRTCSSEPGPLLLQDHYHPDAAATPMRFRNIWVRPL